MITDLTSALTKDIISFLKKETGFFALNTEQRQQKAPALSTYFADMSEEDFVNDLERTVKASRGEAPLAESKMIQKMGKYFSIDFPAIFDQLDRDFYRMSAEDQQKKLEGLFSDKAHFFDALKYQISLLSMQEMTEAIVTFLRDLHGSPRILVQSPAECKTEIKTEIRQHFLQEHPNSFVAFSFNAQLIGGIRFFVDGKVQDLSWFSKIESIKRLSNLVS
jgi:hypothetical protein